MQRIVENRRAPYIHDAAEQGERATPGWMRAIENISYIPAFLLGVYSATWPTVIAAAGEVARAGPSTPANGGLVCAFRRRGLLDCSGRRRYRHVLGSLGRTPRASPTWLTIHSRAVITALLLAAGTLLCVRGLSGLL